MGRVKGSITKDRSIDAEALREVLKPIYEKLRAKGVSDADLPNNEKSGSDHDFLPGLGSLRLVQVV